MNDIYQRLQSHRTGDRSDLADSYRAARDLEVQQLAEKTIRQAGKGASPEFLKEVAVAILEASQSRGGSR